MRAAMTPPFIARTVGMRQTTWYVPVASGWRAAVGALKGKLAVTRHNNPHGPYLRRVPQAAAVVVDEHGSLTAANDTTASVHCSTCGVDSCWRCFTAQHPVQGTPSTTQLQDTRRPPVATTTSTPPPTLPRMDPAATPGPCSHRHSFRARVAVAGSGTPPRHDGAVEAVFSRCCRLQQGQYCATISLLRVLPQREARVRNVDGVSAVHNQWGGDVAAVAAPSLDGRKAGVAEPDNEPVLRLLQRTRPGYWCSDCEATLCHACFIATHNVVAAVYRSACGRAVTAVDDDGDDSSDVDDGGSEFRGNVPLRRMARPRYHHALPLCVTATGPRDGQCVARMTAEYLPQQLASLHGRTPLPIRRATPRMSVAASLTTSVMALPMEARTGRSADSESAASAVECVPATPLCTAPARISGVVNGVVAALAIIKRFLCRRLCGRCRW